MRDIKEMAKEAGFSSAAGKHIALDVELEAFASLVRADERNSPLQQKPYRPVKTYHEGKPVYVAEQCEDCPVEVLSAQQEPAGMRDAIVATLVREGIGKHRARELADHFVGLATAPAWVVPDALTTADKESPDYTDGWNDCRQAMLAS